MPGPVPVHTKIPVSHLAPVELVDSRPNRRSIILYNDSTQYLYIMYGAGLDLVQRDFTLRIPPNWYGTMPWGGVYEGKIYGQWLAANPGGFAQITELVN